MSSSNSKKILVVGSGAREHAICWGLRRSRRVSEVLCAPGNPGISSVARCFPIAVDAVEELLALAISEGVNLVVVGPEAALSVGIVDRFEAAGVPIVGPCKAAAQLEISKSFAKEIMHCASVPTASYEVFTSREALERYLDRKGIPIVLKADGLASGKGVFVITDTSQLSPAMDQLFGELNVSKVVAEEMLSGFEVSCIFASNGRQIVPLAPAHDYKRLLDQDKGPNTGGMGSVCPTPRILAEDLRWIGERCAQPIIDAMIKRGAPFKGFLYAGLMIDPNKPYDLGVRVLEYNTRLGDPECQSIMVRLKSDPLDLYEWITGDNNEVPELQWDDRIAACVVIGSDGYPEAPVRGDVISGIELAALVPSTVVFHAGTTIDNRGELVASGGRSLSVVGLGDSVSKARQVAYQAVDMIQLRGRRIRRDIGL